MKIDFASLPKAYDEHKDAFDRAISLVIIFHNGKACLRARREFKMIY